MSVRCFRNLWSSSFLTFIHLYSLTDDILHDYAVLTPDENEQAPLHVWPTGWFRPTGSASDRIDAVLRTGMSSGGQALIGFAFDVKLERCGRTVSR